MKKETFVLKSAVFLIALPIVAMALFGFPLIIQDAAASSTQMAIVLYGILAGLLISIFPFFVGLYQAFKLLSYIDQNEAFSEESVTALKKIKQYAGLISGLHLVSLPLYYIVGEVDDAPGVILIGMIFVITPTVIAVFAAVLQKLLENAIDIKLDNDLTI